MPTSRPFRPPVRAPTPTTAGLRRDNLGRCLRLVHEIGAVSRAELTQRLGLARATVGVLIDELVSAGYLTERAPESAGTRGRPSPVIDVVASSVSVLAVDLAPESVRLTLVGLGGRIVSRQEWSYEPGAPDASIARLLSELTQVGERRRRAGARFRAVGVAVWGAVRSSDGFIDVAPNLGWHDVPLGARLREALLASSPRARPLVQHIAVGNDCDLGALAEYRRGAGRGARRLLYVHSNIGVGGGLVCDGKLFGAGGSYTGEVGHMIVNPAGLRCRCGAVGCWETEIDERALLRAAGQKGVPDAEVTRQVSRVLAAAQAGDRRARRAVESIAVALGAGLANLVHILGPDRIVIGGYLAELHASCSLPTRRILAERGFSAEARDVPIVAAALGADAQIVGATEISLEPLLADPLAFV